jgi:serine/threonine protein kinase
VLDLQFVLPKVYRVTKLLGRGSFGVVCSGEMVKDDGSTEKVAIKKMLKIFREKTETKRLLREIRLLRFFNHENIIKIKTLLNPMRV